MTDDTQTLRIGPTVAESTIRRIVRVLLALLGLLVVLALAAVLPGIDRLLAGLAISPDAVLSAIATALVVVALLWIAPMIEGALKEGLDGPDSAVTNAAASAKLLAVFAAVVVAYHGLAPAVVPLFRAFDLGGVYHLAFLAVGVIALVAFARRLYRCWTPVTEVAAAYATDALGRDRHDGISTD